MYTTSVVYFSRVVYIGYGPPYRAIYITYAVGNASPPYSHLWKVRINHTTLKCEA